MAISVSAPTRATRWRSAMRAATRIVATAAALSAISCLAGCASPRETFDFSPGARVSHGAGAPVAVEVPSAPAVLDSDRLLLRDEDGSLVYLADAQWSDTLPRLVQARLIERLERHGTRAVRPGDPARYRLSIDLRRFEIDKARQTATVEIVAQLSNDKGGALVAEAPFSGEAPAPHTFGPDAVRAFEAALDMAADRLAAWLRSRR